MKIEITEEKGIKDGQYGHLQQGEIRVVDDRFGAFCCANGWARDVEGVVATGTRGQLDRMNPAEYRPGAVAKVAPAIEPKSTLHK